MTMIACTFNNSTPIIIGDILISSNLKPASFILPTHSDDVVQFLADTSKYHPHSLSHKIYILKSNVCIAFSGDVAFFKTF